MSEPVAAVILVICVAYVVWEFQGRWPRQQCATCGEPGYGAGLCASCDQLVCYECAKAESRGGEGEFWFCPDCSKNKSQPTAAINRYGQEIMISAKRSE